MENACMAIKTRKVKVIIQQGKLKTDIERIIIHGKETSNQLQKPFVGETLRS